MGLLPHMRNNSVYAFWRAISLYYVLYGRDRNTFTALSRNRRSFLSRRTVLKGSAIAGGSLAVAGGAALATYEVMAYANNTQVHTSVDPMQKKTQAEKTQPTYKGQVREYWIQVDAFFHNLVPTGVDGMMGMQYQADQTSYWALGYRAYTPNWGS